MIATSRISEIKKEGASHPPVHWELHGPSDLFLGSAVLDILVTPLEKILPRGKCDVRVALQVGSAASNAARTYARLSGPNVPVLAAITDDGPFGRLIMDRLREEFEEVRRIPTAETSRLSVVLPGLDDSSGQTLTLTQRSAIDGDRTFALVSPLLREQGWLFLGSFQAADRPLIEELLARHQGPTYLMVSPSQAADRDGTINLLRHASLVQMNGNELAQFTGKDDIVDAMTDLRTAGVRRIVVTAGERGAFAYADGQSPSSLPYRVDVKSDLGAGDCVAGALIASLRRGVPFETGLRYACAAAAMHISGQPCPDWNSLLKFAERAPRSHRALVESRTRIEPRRDRTSAVASRKRQLFAWTSGAILAFAFAIYWLVSGA